MKSLRRSILYVPGDSAKMLQKSPSLGADVALLNLEDGVAAAKKAEARDNIVRALHELDFASCEVVVRINSLRGPIGRADLEALPLDRLDGICLPKVEFAGEIHAAADQILRLERQQNLPPGRVQLHAMIESPRGILHAAEIAAASARMASLIFGSADFTSEVGCEVGVDRSEIQLALQQLVIAARAGGIDAIDAPCFDLRDEMTLQGEARQARRWGFTGKSALHPKQLAAIHAAFEVTPEQIAWARTVLAELDAAEARGRALSTMEGQMIDNPHRAAAQRILRTSRFMNNPG